jgi:hypothetical protein
MRANVGPGHRLLMGKSLRKPILVGGLLLLLAAATFVVGLACTISLISSPTGQLSDKFRSAGWGKLFIYCIYVYAGASEILKPEEDGGSAENSSANDTDLSEKSGAVKENPESQVHVLKQSTPENWERDDILRRVAEG